MKIPLMVVRIQVGRGPVVTRRKGKNSRIARLGASALTLGSISCFVLGAWRLGKDLDLASEFVFPDGLLSHWQVWLGSAAAVQYSAWRLTRYAKLAEEHAAAEQLEPATGHPAESKPAVVRAVAAG